MLFFIAEILGYIIIIYGLSIFTITVEPSIITASIIFAACFAASWYSIEGCKSNLMQDNHIKGVIIGIYAVSCTMGYLAVHYLWKMCGDEQLKNYFKLGLLLAPAGFLLSTRLIETFLECEPYHIINTPKRLFISD